MNFISINLPHLLDTTEYYFQLVYVIVSFGYFIIYFSVLIIGLIIYKKHSKKYQNNAKTWFTKILNTDIQSLLVSVDDFYENMTRWQKFEYTRLMGAFIDQLNKQAKIKNFNDPSLDYYFIIADFVNFFLYWRNPFEINKNLLKDKFRHEAYLWGCEQIKKYYSNDEYRFIFDK